MLLSAHPLPSLSFAVYLQLWMFDFELKGQKFAFVSGLSRVDHSIVFLVNVTLCYASFVFNWNFEDQDYVM